MVPSVFVNLSFLDPRALVSHNLATVIILILVTFTLTIILIANHGWLGLAHNRHETPVLKTPIKIIYIDDDLLVLDKPCSLPVSSAFVCPNGNPTPRLAQGNCETFGVEFDPFWGARCLNKLTIFAVVVMYLKLGWPTLNLLYFMILTVINYVIEITLISFNYCCPEIVVVGHPGRPLIQPLVVHQFVSLIQGNK